MAAVRILEI